MKREMFSGFAGRVIICLLLLSCGGIVVAQEPLVKSEYSYRRYTTQDGLPNFEIIKLHQDSRGFIWIGSTRGFSRFDGFKFTDFLSGTLNNIYYINSSPDGIVRAYSQRDVFIVDTNDSIRRVKLAADTLDLTFFNSRYLPKNYLIYENAGPGYVRRYLARIENDSIIDLLRIPELDTLNSGVYTYIDDNKLYIPSHKEKIIFVYDLQTREVSVLGFIAEIFIRHSKLGLLAITNKGIYSISGSTFTKIVDAFDESNYVIDSCAEAEDGSIYFSSTFSIYRFYNGKVEKKISLPSGNRDLLIDNDKNLWVINGQGLYNFFQFNFQNFTLEKNLPVNSFVEDESGIFWFITNDKWIYQYSDNETKKIQYQFVLDFDGYNCAAHGYIYFSAEFGTAIKDKNIYRWVKEPYDVLFRKVHPLPNREILTLSVHALYRCTAEGELIRTYGTDFLCQDEIFDVVIDNRGRWIVGGSKGVSVVDGENVNLYSSEFSSYTNTLDVDFQGNIWSHSEGRLNLIRRDSLEIAYRFNESVQTLKVLKNGFLAVTTTHGLYLMNISNYLSSGVMQHLYYDRQNGMTGLYPKAYGIVEDSKGMVWIKTSDCMVRFDPQKLIRQVSKPNLVIQQSAVSKDNVNWENIDDFANTKFSYKNKNIKFTVIGLQYSAAENVRYHYRLLGFQNEWSEPTKNREVTFNNLPPGDYVFEIYADAGTDESRCETQSFAFSIKPAFWQTTWFLVACIASLMLSSAFVALYIQRRKNRELLEKLRAEKELNELRISSIRLKAIPHFNANVLAAIEYYIANRTKEEAMRILGIYSDFTYKTLSEVDKAARPLSEELEYVKMYLDLEKIRFLEKFDFQIKIDDEVDKTVQLPNMILHTYCENAVKHGLMPLKSGGLLTINVTQRDQIVFVSVEDNGVGRDYAAQNPQLHSSKQGLSILNRQIEIYNRFNKEKINQQIDDLSAETGQSSGTRFTVEVPIEFSYLN